jgi:hypothetical protein
MPAKGPKNTKIGMLIKIITFLNKNILKLVLPATLKVANKEKRQKWQSKKKIIILDQNVTRKIWI